VPWRSTSRRFIGRDRELALLGRVLEEARDGGACLVLVSGEAGVGKSRLLRETAARAAALDMAVARGECIQLSDGELPFAPVVAALRNLDRRLLGRASERLPAESAAELARLIPELRARPAAAESALGQARLYEVLLAVLGELGSERPVALVLEDAQWADGSTRDFLSYLARNLSCERAAVMASYRSDDLAAKHPLRDLVADLERRDTVARVALERLTSDEVDAMLEGVLAEPPPRALADEIFRRSGGNPYFVEELAAAGGRRLPVNLRDALLRRVHHQPEYVQRVLRVLATVGRPTPQALLGAVAEVPEPDLSRALRDCLAAGLLLRVGQERLDFRHALVREAVVGEVLPVEAVELHRRVAWGLLEFDDPRPAELASHWSATGELAAALVASIDAGLEAERVYSYVDARNHFLRALELWGRAGVFPEQTALDHVELLMHAGEAQCLTGDWDAAVLLMRQALEAVDPVGEPLRAAALHERIGDSIFWDDDEAADHYREALRLLPERCARERGRCLGALALRDYHRGRWHDARERARAALDMAVAMGAHAEEIYPRMTLGTVEAFVGDAELGETQARRALELAKEHGRGQDLARAYAHLGDVLRTRGRIEEALALMLEAEEAATRLGMGGSFGRAFSVGAAEDLVRLGRWAEADERLRRSSRLDLRLATELLQRTLQGTLAVARGEVPEAREHLEAAERMCDELTAPDYRAGVDAARAELELWEGRPELAWDVVRDALAVVRGREDPLYTPILFSLGVRAAADLAQRCGRAPRGAGQLVRRLAEIAARAAPGAAPAEAAAHLVLCRAEHARSRLRPAPRAWAKAVSAWEALRQPYPAAYARLRQAEAAFEAGELTVAGAALERAAAVAFELRAEPLRTAIETLADSGVLINGHCSAKRVG
jgi:tetratricopeptide (TPR) repeat protein